MEEEAPPGDPSQQGSDLRETWVGVVGRGPWGGRATAEPVIHGGVGTDGAGARSGARSTSRPLRTGGSSRQFQPFDLCLYLGVSTSEHFHRRPSGAMGYGARGWWSDGDRGGCVCAWGSNMFSPLSHHPPPRPSVSRAVGGGRESDPSPKGRRGGEGPGLGRSGPKERAGVEVLLA